MKPIKESFGVSIVYGGLVGAVVAALFRARGLDEFHSFFKGSFLFSGGGVVIAGVLCLLAQVNFESVKKRRQLPKMDFPKFVDYVNENSAFDAGRAMVFLVYSGRLLMFFIGYIYAMLGFYLVFVRK